MPVINLLCAIVGMEEISPRDVHQDNVSFRLERYIWVIENLNCRKRSFARFLQQLFFDGENSANTLVGAHAVSSAPCLVTLNAPLSSFGSRVSRRVARVRD